MPEGYGSRATTLCHTAPLATLALAPLMPKNEVGVGPFMGKKNIVEVLVVLSAEGPGCKGADGAEQGALHSVCITET